MKGFRRCLCSLLLCIFLFPVSAFCLEEGISFTDDLGREITVSSPQKTAALSGSLADLWLLAGGQLCCVTQDALEERALKLPEDIIIAGSLKKPSAEIILSSGADFVLLTPTLDGQTSLQDTLEAAHVPCAYFDLETFEDYLRILDILTSITGSKANYEAYGLSVQAQVQAAILQSAGKAHPSVLLLRAYSSGVKAKNSENNMVGAMLKDLGCVNIADSDSGLMEDLSLEKILVSDPDYIFITTMGADDAALSTLAEGLETSPVWAALTAVKEGRCVVLPQDLFHYKPNARWGESYQTLSDILYGQ